MPDDPSPEELGRAAASHLGGDWQLDADVPAEEPGEPGVSTPGSAPRPPSPPPPNRGVYTPRSPETPPPAPEQIVEAMLFVGGHPLTPATACAAVRGLTPEAFRAAVDTLNRRYRSQNRPYLVQPRDGGFVLAVQPAYRGLRERLFGGPREARLSPQAVDVLSVVAYRQPVGKAAIDAIRGTDGGSVLRQLVRLGLIAVQHRADAESREVRYGTTPRFLQLFGLASLDELPRLGDTEPG
jgi:segregation and condensation protein B